MSLGSCAVLKGIQEVTWVSKFENPGTCPGIARIFEADNCFFPKYEDDTGTRREYNNSEEF